MAVTVYVHANENIDRVLKRLKKAVDNAGILQALKNREFYEKPSVKRHNKKQAFKRRNALNLIKQKEKEKCEESNKMIF